MGRASGKPSAYLSEKGSVPLYVVTVAGVGSLDFRVERADDVVEHLHSDIISSHARACTPCVLIRGLKNFKGAKSAGKTPVFSRSETPSLYEEKKLQHGYKAF